MSERNHVAEKLEALVVLGLTTSRMKDLYDLDLLRREFEFDDLLVEAVRASFGRRRTPIPADLAPGVRGHVWPRRPVPASIDKR
jgi:hypothetical protein